MRFPVSRSRSRSRLARLAIVVGGLAIASLIVAALTAARTDALTPREQALHVLNRLSFGPRPGDVDRVVRSGVSSYIEEQLHPERIPDGRVEARLSASNYPALAMSNAQIIANFEVPLLEARRKIKAERAANAKADDGEATDAEVAKARELIPPEQRPKRILEELTAARILRASESERQLNEVMVDFWMNHFNVYANKGQDRFAIVSFERDTVRPHIWAPSSSCCRPRPSRRRCSSTWTTPARWPTKITGPSSAPARRARRGPQEPLEVSTRTTRAS